MRLHAWHCLTAIQRQLTTKWRSVSLTDAVGNTTTQPTTEWQAFLASVNQWERRRYRMRSVITYTDSLFESPAEPAADQKAVSYQPVRQVMRQPAGITARCTVKHEVRHAVRHAART